MGINEESRLNKQGKGGIMTYEQQRLSSFGSDPVAPTSGVIISDRISLGDS